MVSLRFECEDDIEKLYGELFNGLKRNDARDILKKIHEVCRKLVRNNSKPTISSVVKILGSNGVDISLRTLYNRRNGDNPYPIIIDAWAGFIESKTSRINSVSGNEESGFLSNDDFNKIKDPVLQHKVMILFGQVESLKNQNSTLREISSLPIVTPNHIDQSKPEMLLSKYDEEVLENFVNGIDRLGLKFDDNGTLCTMKGIPRDTILSDPGLKDAIEKVLIKVGRLTKR